MEYRFEIVDFIKMFLFFVMVFIIDEWRIQFYRENVCDEMIYFFEVLIKLFYCFLKGILIIVFVYLFLVKFLDWFNYGLVFEKNKVYVLIYNDY